MKQIKILLLFLFPLIAFAQNSLQNKVVILQRLLQKTHYSPVVWNDTSANLLYKKWLNVLDKEKLFFTEKEISSLNKIKLSIDDELLGKGWDFFNQSTQLYRQRLAKVDSMVKLILQKPLDFTKPDNLTWPVTNYATNEGELNLRWQRYIKWQVLNFIAKTTEDSVGVNTKIPANFTKLEETARQVISRREQAYIKNLMATPATFIPKLEDKYLNAIAWCYDPHTNYFNAKKKIEFDAATSATEFSSGLDIDQNDDGEIKIDYLQPGSNAWKSGQLHKGDVVKSVVVDGVEKDVKDMDEEDVEEALNGTTKNDVQIVVKSAAGETRKVKIEREKITDDDAIVKSYVLRGKQNIGYINLPGFYSRENEEIKTEKDITFDGCANDVSKEIVKLKKDSIGGLILDLRYNGGGSMWEAMQLAGIFIDIGPVASVKEKDGKDYVLKDPNRGTIYDGSIVVLINGASASASEFVSAALQDYNRAVIVGSSTYGKGTAQLVVPLDTNEVDKNKTYDDFIKITMRKFYRVNGSTTQWMGVVPDIALPDLFDGAEDTKEKNVESALKPDMNRVLSFKSLPVLPVASLAAKSNLRVKTNTTFQQLTNFNAWLKKYNTARTISLQWSSYAIQFNEAIKQYKLIENDDGKTEKPLIAVSNNGFDKQKIQFYNTRGKAVNQDYLDDIATDEAIIEAYNILMDWNNK